MKKIFGGNKMKVNKGDEVIVICGKDKGKKGIVKIVFAKSSLIVVEGINKFKKAVKIGNGNNENFLIKERPFFASKVKVVKKNQKGSSKKVKKEVKG